jgi:hypothetical protein
MKLPVRPAHPLSYCELPEGWEGTALDLLNLKDEPLDYILEDVLYPGFLEDEVCHQFTLKCKERLMSRLAILEYSTQPFMDEGEQECSYEEFLAGYTRDIDAAILERNAQKAFWLAAGTFMDPDEESYYDFDTLEALVKDLKELISKHYEVSL